MGSHKVKRRRKLRKQREEDRRLGRKLGIPLGKDPAPDYEETKMLMECRSSLHEGPNPLPVENFSRRKGHKRGYQYECKACRVKMDRARRAKVKEGIAQKEAAKKKDPKRKKSTNPRRSGKIPADRLRQIGNQIAEGKSVAEGFSNRGLNNAIKMIIAQQLRLHYVSSDTDSLAKRKLAEIIEDAVSEVSVALGRVGSRVRNMKNAYPDRDYINEVDQTVADREKAFAVLGLEESSSEKEIKNTYRRLARQHHSDRGGNDGRMGEINAAYATLREGFGG